MRAAAPGRGLARAKLYGEGEWKVRLHGADRRRTWRKLHLLIDHDTQEAAACSMSGQYVLDRRELRKQCSELLYKIFVQFV